MDTREDQGGTPRNGRRGSSSDFTHRERSLQEGYCQYRADIRLKIVLRLKLKYLNVNLNGLYPDEI